MPKILSFEALIRGGAEIDRRLRVPLLASDPAAPADGEVWVHASDNALRWRSNGLTRTAGEAGALNAEDVEDIVAGVLTAGNNIGIVYDDALNTLTINVDDLSAADITDFDAAATSAARAAVSVADTATLDLTYNSGTGQITGVVLDSPTVDGANPAQLRDRSTHTGTQQASTISDFAASVHALSIDAATLNGQSASALQTAVIAAITDSAPGTLDTLNELAAALGNDPNFATTITNALNARSRPFVAALAGASLVSGVATETVAHGLNTRDVTVQVYDNVSYEEVEFVVRRATVNSVEIVSEGAVIPAGYRVVIHAVGNA